MPLCGLKVVTTFLILSTWGIIQLAFTGLCLHFRAISFVEDIPVAPHIQDPSLIEQELEKGYSQAALNCGIASLLYLLTFCASLHQYWLHKRISEVESEQFFNFIL